MGIDPDYIFPEGELWLCRRKYCREVLYEDVDFTGTYHLSSSSVEGEVSEHTIVSEHTVDSELITAKDDDEAKLHAPVRDRLSSPFR